jgi:TPR repeat protein
MFRYLLFLMILLCAPLMIQAQDENDTNDHYFGENYNLRSHIDDLIDDQVIDSAATIVMGLEKLSVCKDERHQVWALNKLADLYFKGFGPIVKDIPKALGYTDQAIKLKSHLAMSRLATCYFFGMGLDKDQQKGLTLAKQANEMSKSNAFASELAKKKGGGMYDDLVEKMEQMLAAEKK